MSAVRLERTIGLGGAVLLSFNGAVGAGIFALPAVLAADFGSFAPWLFPSVAVLSLVIVWPFARSVAAFPQSGGPATYGRVFGRLAGFELGWVYYLARVAAFAANANVLVAYLGRWVPPLGEGMGRAAVLTAVVGAIALANAAGTRRALTLLGGLTLLKALPLLLIAIAALAAFAPWPAPGAPPPLSGFEAGALLVFYAFVGFENVVVPAGETKRPSVTLGRAILITIGTTAALYFLVQLAFVAAFPGGGIDNDSPLIDLGALVAGPAGAALLTLAAIFSLAGNLHGNMTATPRVTHAMGEAGDLPPWFARVSSRFSTPSNSILFMAAAALVLALTGSFVWLAVVSTLARLLVYAATIAALPRAPEAPPVTAFHRVSGAAGIALCGYAAAQADARAWWTLAALAASGLVLYALAARGSRSPSAAERVSAIQPPPSTREPS